MIQHSTRNNKLSSNGSAGANGGSQNQSKQNSASQSLHQSRRQGNENVGQITGSQGSVQDQQVKYTLNQQNYQTATNNYGQQNEIQLDQKSNQLQSQGKQRPVLRTQSRDKKTSVDPFKNLITQVPRGDDQLTVPAPPVVVIPKSTSVHRKYPSSFFYSGYSQQHMNIPGAANDLIDLLGPQSRKNKGRKTLVLDLDETLVHSSFKPPDNPDIVLPVEIEGKICYVYVLVRPGTISFLEEMSEYYEIIIYTASLSKYAEPLMKILDQGDWCTTNLYREHCTFHNGAFVKDMTQLGRNLKDIIIVDNSPSSYQFQPENALPSISWYDDKNDEQLFEFMPVLKELSTVDDVRPFLMASVKDNVFDCEKCLKLIQVYKEQHHNNSQQNKQSVVSDRSRGKEETKVATSVTNSSSQLKRPNTMGSAEQNKRIAVKPSPLQDSHTNLSQLLTGIKKSDSVKSSAINNSSILSKTITKKQPFTITKIQKDTTASAKRYLTQTQPTISSSPHNVVAQHHQSGNNVLPTQQESDQKKKRPLTTSKVVKKQVPGIQTSLVADQNNLNSKKSPRQQSARVQHQVQPVKILRKTSSNNQQNANHWDSTSEASNTQNEHINPHKQLGNKNSIAGQVQHLNQSKEKKLITEIATSQSNSLTRDQIIQMRQQKPLEVKQHQIVKVNKNGESILSNILNDKRKSSSTNYVQVKASSLNKRSSRTQNLNLVNQNNHQQPENNVSGRPSLTNKVQTPSKISQISNSHSTKNLKNDEVERTPHKYTSMSTRNRESLCEIAGESDGIQKPHTTETSINRTPKSEINQPGKIFEQSATRGSSVHNPTNSSCKKEEQNSMLNITNLAPGSYTQPKIMNFNSRFAATNKSSQIQQQLNDSQQFTNLLRQKIDFKGIDVNKNENPNDSSSSSNLQIGQQSASKNTNALSIFKFNSPKHGVYYDSKIGGVGQNSVSSTLNPNNPNNTISSQQISYLMKSELSNQGSQSTQKSNNHGSGGGLGSVVMLHKSQIINKNTQYRLGGPQKQTTQQKTNL